MGVSRQRENCATRNSIWVAVRITHVLSPISRLSNSKLYSWISGARYHLHSRFINEARVTGLEIRILPICRLEGESRLNSRLIRELAARGRVVFRTGFLSILVEPTNVCIGIYLSGASLSAPPVFFPQSPFIDRSATGAFYVCATVS